MGPIDKPERRLRAVGWRAPRRPQAAGQSLRASSPSIARLSPAQRREDPRATGAAFLRREAIRASAPPSAISYWCSRRAAMIEQVLPRRTLKTAQRPVNAMRQIIAANVDACSC
jgi:hypothetical protein